MKPKPASNNKRRYESDTYSFFILIRKYISFRSGYYIRNQK